METVLPTADQSLALGRAGHWIYTLKYKNRDLMLGTVPDNYVLVTTPSFKNPLYGRCVRGDVAVPKSCPKIL